MKYPEYIMRYVRERLDLEPDDTSKDEEINMMTPTEVFTEWLEWQGIIGYSDTILQAVEDIFDIELQNINI